MTRKSKINKQQLLIEFFSVIFAVLLALLLNSWREAALRAETAQEVKAKIRQEVLYNDNELKKALEYHEELLSELYENRHVVRSIALQGFPVDVSDNQSLTAFIGDILLFEANQIVDVEILQKGGRRLLKIADNVYQMQVEQDTLFLYGKNNFQLRTAGIRTSSWEIAQATGVLVDMNMDLVSALASLNTLQTQYINTTQLALNMLYDGRTEGMQSVLEDLRYIEGQMIELHEKVLIML